MGNRDTCLGQIQHQTFSWWSRPAYISSPKEKPPSKWIWQPGLPAWEKQFCLEVGLFTWQKFLKAKKYIHLSENIMRWDDSAGEEAFNNAKNRFRDRFHNLPCHISPPDPNMFIDEIDWNSETNKSISRVEGEADEIKEEPSREGIHQSSAHNLLFDYKNIKPTGWDVDIIEFSNRSNCRELAKTTSVL